jgi:hypothetical protein
MQMARETTISIEVVLTSSGGLRPHFLALFHLCSRVMPTEGPYFEVMSNVLKISAILISNIPSRVIAALTMNVIVGVGTSVDYARGSARHSRHHV